MSERKIQIVIVGGGAGGLELARRLGAKYGRRRHDIILVERNRTHIWKPLLHEVAAGSLDANLDEVGFAAIVTAGVIASSSARWKASIASMGRSWSRPCSTRMAAS